MQVVADYIPAMEVAPPKTRLFLDADFDSGLSLSPTSDQQHYLTTVMRLDWGAAVAVFNGRDGEWLAQIEKTGRRSCKLTLERPLRLQQASPDLWLMFAPVKKARLDFIVEKASEMGCRCIWPVRTAHTQVSRVNTDRMLANAIEAAEQTERLDIPDIREFIPLSEALTALEDDRRLIFCDEAAASIYMDNAIDVLKAADPMPRSAILIGPEGGFSDYERTMLASRQNCLIVSLGPRILRADTAAIAALTCFQSVCGDWVQ